MRILVIDKTAGLSSSHERHQYIAAQPGVELHVLGPSHWIESGRDIRWEPQEDRRYHAHPGKVFGKDYYARAGYYSGLSRALRLSRPDIIQLLEEPWSVSALQTVLAAAIFAPGTPIFFYTWENIYREWVYPSRASWLYARIDKVLHSVAAGAVCATEGARDVLRQKGFNKPIRTIPYGIPDFFFASQRTARPDDRPFTLGYVGRLLPMKGIDLLFSVLEARKEWNLILAGSGPEEASYRDRARQMSIDSRIEWIPPVVEQRIPDVLSRMDVFVLPSRRVEGWQEQLGRAAIEAMATGIPVVGSMSGAIPEVLGDAGLLFQENSVKDLTEKITFLKENSDERNRLGLRGMERASQVFTWRRFANELCSFYRHVVSGH